MKTTRREFIKTVGLGTTVLAVPGLMTLGCLKKTRPNILFIMSDDHAERAISCYGSDLIQTPGIDRIATEGIRFEKSFVTNSICGPSRATLLTGKYAHLNGFKDHRDTFDGSQVTFPKLLQEVGYQTAIVGKWHLKSDPTGFNTWNILKGQGQYYNPTFIEEGTEHKYVGYTTDLITDKAIQTLDNLDKDKPFCMLVHHKAPHRNWMPNLKHLEALTDEELPLPETFYDDYAGRQAAGDADMRIDDMYLSFDLKLQQGYYDHETGTGGKASYAKTVVKTWENTYNRLTDEQKTAWDAHYNKLNEEFKALNLEGDELLQWKYQNYLKDYLRCILSVDENVGRLLNYLDQQGLTENTIVVYTSDQGFYLGEHGWYDKRFMYEESLGMPLVMRYPQEIQAGQVSQDLVMNLDFASTFLDFAGVTIPAEMQGASLRSIVKGQTTDDWRQTIYYHYYENERGWHNVRGHYGIRTERYKLIYFFRDNNWELFDLEQDPNEINNVYADPAYADVLLEMQQELKETRLLYGDE
ncbi:MAG: sulfatase [Candidatus Marinimicrobia bacterium]|nr:sulfatase [Candidatus Neomarinimicrobiota bacterium]